MNEPGWLSPTVVLAIHEETLSLHGGLAGLRDPGALASALARPRNLFEYGEGDVFDLAAAYVCGIVRNHPFADGNKRTGFLAGYVFLAVNGQEFDASEPDVVVTISALAAGEMTEQEVAGWLRRNCRPLT